MIGRKVYQVTTAASTCSAQREKLFGAAGIALLLARRSDSMAATLSKLSTSSDTPSVTTARPVLSPLHVDVGALTHVGHVRTNNEDHFLVARATRALETMLTSLPAGDVPQRADEVNYVMVVADGMGGHAAGEVASRLAISASSIWPWTSRTGSSG